VDKTSSLPRNKDRNSAIFASDNDLRSIACEIGVMAAIRFRILTSILFRQDTIGFGSRR